MNASVSHGFMVMENHDHAANQEFGMETYVGKGKWAIDGHRHLVLPSIKEKCQRVMCRNMLLFN